MSNRDQQKYKKEEKQQEYRGVLCNKREQEKGEAGWVNDLHKVCLLSNASKNIAPHCESEFLSNTMIM